jgi:hypothetical protein
MMQRINDENVPVDVNVGTSSTPNALLSVKPKDVRGSHHDGTYSGTSAHVNSLEAVHPNLMPGHGHLSKSPAARTDATSAHKDDDRESDSSESLVISSDSDSDAEESHHSSATTPGMPLFHPIPRTIAPEQVIIHPTASPATLDCNTQAATAAGSAAAEDPGCDPESPDSIMLSAASSWSLSSSGSGCEVEQPHSQHKQHKTPSSKVLSFTPPPPSSAPGSALAARRQASAPVCSYE